MPSESTKATRVARVSFEGTLKLTGHVYEIMSNKTINYMRGPLGGYLLTDKNYIDTIEETETLELSDGEFETLMGLVENLQTCKADNSFWTGFGEPLIVQASVGRKIHWTFYRTFYEPEYPSINWEEIPELRGNKPPFPYVHDKPELLDIAYFLIDTFPDYIDREVFSETPKDLKEQGVLDENGNLTDEYAHLSRKWRFEYPSYYELVMEPEEYKEYWAERERVFEGHR